MDHHNTEIQVEEVEGTSVSPLINACNSESSNEVECNEVEGNEVEGTTTYGIFTRLWNWATSSFKQRSHGEELPPMPAMLIAIGHQARSGKDTFANRFIERFPETAYLSFAAPLYEIAQSLQSILGLNIEKDPELMQKLGDLIKSKYGNDFFAEHMRKKIETIIAEDPNCSIVVSDLRCNVEYDMLTKITSSNGTKFSTIKINRSDRPIDRDITHPSETELTDTPFDITVDNNGSLDDFITNIDEAIFALTFTKIQNHVENSLKV